MKKMLKRIVIGIIVIIVLLFTAFNVYVNNIKKENPSGELTIEDLKELSKTVKDDRINILLLGVDHLDGAEKHENMRTDTMMLLSVDPKKKTAFILSIPRDTRVEIDGLKDKIAHAHSYGGVSLTLKTVKNFLNIPINHFVKVDYKALSKTVDDIGGVDIDVPMDMHYEDPYAKPPLYIDLKKGYQTLDGSKAMQFLRFRSGYADQDLGRIQSQQKFVESFVRKILSADSISRIPNYIDTFYRYVQTDMTVTDMLKVASKCIDIKPHNIRKERVVGEPKNLPRGSYYITDEEKVRAQLNDLLTGDYYKEEENQTEEQKNENGGSSRTPQNNQKADKNKKDESQEPKPYIVVLNGDGKSGLAQRAIDLLFVNDIEVQDSSNADNFDYKETVIYYKTNKMELAQEVAKILGTGKIVQENKAYYDKTTDVLVVLGSDFTK